MTKRVLTVLALMVCMSPSLEVKASPTHRLIQGIKYGSYLAPIDYLALRLQTCPEKGLISERDAATAGASSLAFINLYTRYPQTFYIGLSFAAMSAIGHYASFKRR